LASKAGHHYEVCNQKWHKQHEQFSDYRAVSVTTTVSTQKTTLCFLGVLYTVTVELLRTHGVLRWNYTDRKTDVLGEKPVSEPFCPP